MSRALSGGVRGRWEGVEAVPAPASQRTMPSMLMPPPASYPGSQPLMSLLNTVPCANCVAQVSARGRALVMTGVMRRRA